MWRQAVVFSVLVSGAFAALALAKLDDKPDKYSNVSGCYISELDIMVPFGQATPSKLSCKEYRCSEDYVTHVTCGAVDVHPPCYKIKDLSKPYPACCPTAACPETVDTNAATPDTDDSNQTENED